jgi:hypothetical protein
MRRLRSACACVLAILVWLTVSNTVQAQDVVPAGPTMAWAASGAIGFMRGGRNGGLFTAQMTPIAVEVQTLSLADDPWMYGGALRIELEQVMAVAGIAKIAYRHPVGALELRPGASLPFYVAPRTMLGPQADLGVRLKISTAMGVLGQLSAAAFFIGNDVPHGSTIVMFHLFFGVELML